MLSDHLAGRKTVLKDGLDWGKLLKLSNAHEVAGIVYHQCKSWLSQEQRSRYEQTYCFAFYAYANRCSAIKKIQHSFASNGIEYVTVKGLDIANYYPIPALRTMGDLDIVIHQKNKELADKLLVSLGFQTKIKNPSFDWVYFCDGMEYELHHQLLYKYDDDINDPLQVKFFNNLWPYADKGRLDWNFHFLFLLIHLKKHLMLYGAGFRMFFDLAILINSEIDFDWEWIISKVEEFGLSKFVQRCFALLEVWFGIKVPYYCPEIDDELVNRLTERIASDGVFGFSNIDNKANIAMNAIMRNGKQRLRSRIRAFFRKAFPGYKRIAFSKNYGFVENRPWLLPAAWLYRFYRLMLGRTDSASNIVDRIMISNEMIDERENELREWGLISECK